MPTAQAIQTLLDAISKHADDMLNAAWHQIGLAPRFQEGASAILLAVALTLLCVLFYGVGALLKKRRKPENSFHYTDFSKTDFRNLK